ncbi:hypothetical protein PIB30_045841 [Stylosanthes scabra]|uniref:Uncharacterized protein n=1 Tax=Stylosanthes scabra TaxID=79078 RepID=A0ABU6VJ50_9FABA|nr:hypothetical protein [Stylosanthes scabra]
MDDHKAMQNESEELAALLGYILQCHLVPTEPRPSSEFDKVNAPSRLRHILDVTRRHFEGPEKTQTVRAPDAKTASGEEHVSQTLLPNVNASGNTEECARKRKHVSDVDAGASGGNSSNAVHIEGSSNVLPMDLVVPDSPEAQQEVEKIWPHFDIGFPKGDRFRADPSEPLEWSLKAGVSSLQMGTLGGSWPINISKGLTTSPMRPLLFRDPCPPNGVIAPNPPLLIPENFPMIFRPTANMQLNREEIKLAAYIFSVKPSEQQMEHLGEVLLKIGRVEIQRGDLYNLCPQWVVSVRTISTAIAIASTVSELRHPPREWVLPWEFVRDVLGKEPMERILAKYEGKWMPKTTELERVFVTVREGAFSWYIMYLDVQRWKVYPLDVTRTNDTKIEREENMTNLLRFFARLFIKTRNIPNVRHCPSPDPTRWLPFVYPQGLPDGISCYDSAVWCLDWLINFQQFSKNVFYNMSSTENSMRAAIAIVQSIPKYEGSIIKSKAEIMWHKITDPNAYA